MFAFKIFACPLDEVVLENSLDDLVKDVWGYQLVNICTREVLREQLTEHLRKPGV